MQYSEYVDLNEYDKAISCHPYIDACNASIVYRLIEHIGFGGQRKNILDAGSGSGQVVRLLNGIPNLHVEACDIDMVAKDFFIKNPETSEVSYHHWDIENHTFNKHYDAIILRGVYHHLPKDKRPVVLYNLCRQASIVINADEGIKEYKNEAGRIENCNKWYGYVVGEARRRKLRELAKLENTYWQHEKLNTADDGGDFKESPEDFVLDAKKAGVEIVSMEKIGNWDLNGGGFYTAVVKISQK